MRITNFTELDVWQRAMDLVVDVYDLTRRYPSEERFVLTASTRKTAISIPSNIAEGCCRGTTPTYLNHVDIALGSEGELFTQLVLGKRLGFAAAPEIDRRLQQLSEVGKMLRGLHTSLEQRLKDKCRRPDH